MNTESLSTEKIVLLMTVRSLGEMDVLQTAAPVKGPEFPAALEERAVASELLGDTERAGEWRSLGNYQRHHVCVAAAILIREAQAIAKKAESGEAA